MINRRAEGTASIERVQAAVAEIKKALERGWDTQGTDEPNEGQLAVGPVRNEFTEARHEMNMLHRELNVRG